MFYLSLERLSFPLCSLFPQILRVGFPDKGITHRSNGDFNSVRCSFSIIYDPAIGITSVAVGPLLCIMVVIILERFRIHHEQLLQVT